MRRFVPNAVLATLIALVTLVALAGFDTRAAGAAGANDGSCDYRLPVPANAVIVNPGDSVQGAVNSAGNGGAVLLRRGVHLLSSSVLLPRATFPDGVMIAGEDGAILRDDSFSFTAIRGTAPDVTVSNLIVEGFGIRKNSDGGVNSSTWGAVHSANFVNGVVVAPRWTIDHVESHSNEAVGLAVADGGTIRCSIARNNEELGIGTIANPRNGGTNNVTIELNSVRNNNQVPGFHHPEDFGEVADDGNFGGIKAIGLRNSTIANNDVRDNDGAGIWCDLECDNVTIRNNIVINHYLGIGGGPGIQYEVSNNGVIRENIVAGCGSRTIVDPGTQGAWGGGLQIVDSQDVSVAGNWVFNCQRAITVVDLGFRQALRNVSFTNNVFISTDQQIRVALNFEEGGDVASHGMTFSGNIYATTNPAARGRAGTATNSIGFIVYGGNRWNNDEMFNFNEWQNRGHDASGRALFLGR